MPRSIWKGSISFGLVNIPVSLYPGEEASELHFSLLDREDLAPVGYKRINKKTGQEIPWNRIVRGYQHEDGEYVVLTDEDLKRANVQATQTVDLVQFVDAAEIPPMYYERPYYLEPTRKAHKAYALLRETLRRTGKVGIATVVIRTRQHLAALVAEERVLVLNLLRFAHELRKADALDLPDKGLAADLSEREVEMAQRLVEGMVEPFRPDKFKDTYREDVLAFIEKKVKSGQTHVVSEPAEEGETEPRGGAVVDLMPLLKRSLETAGKARPRPSEKPRPRAVAKKSGGRRKSA